jgi:hypothetical protein
MAVQESDTWGTIGVMLTSFLQFLIASVLAILRALRDPGSPVRNKNACPIAPGGETVIVKQFGTERRRR